jgi:hypothetical protein
MSSPTERIENAVLTVYDELSERPILVAVFFAVVTGALGGMLLAGVRPKKKPPTRNAIASLASVAGALALDKKHGKGAIQFLNMGSSKLGHVADDAMDLPELAAMASKLLSNKLVQRYLREAIKARLGL